MDEARTITAPDWMALEPAADPNSPSRPETLRHRLLRPMDPETARSFTEGQLRELERVLTPSASRRPTIDIRITVPFFRRRFFLAFLGGPERRPAERLKEERAKHALWTFANVCSFVFLLALLVPACIGLVHIFTVAS